MKHLPKNHGCATMVALEPFTHRLNSLRVTELCVFWMYRNLLYCKSPATKPPRSLPQNLICVVTIVFLSWVSPLFFSYHIDGKIKEGCLSLQWVHSFLCPVFQISTDKALICGSSCLRSNVLALAVSSHFNGKLCGPCQPLWSPDVSGHSPALDEAQRWDFQRINTPDLSPNLRWTSTKGRELADFRKNTF